MNKKWVTGFALLTSGFLTAQVNLSQSLTACYTLDGNGTEAINNLTATLSAVTATVDRFNNPSSAIFFSGSPLSHLELPNDPLLKPTNAFSFSCWIKTSVLADQYILMTRNQANSNFEAYDLHLGNVSGQLKVRAKKGDGFGNTVEITGTNTLSVNTWYHFVVTVDNTNMNLYTNGILVGSAAITSPFNYLANKKVILGGSNESIFDLPFTGSMDNLRFYNRVINTNEITQLYSTDPACINETSVASLSDPKTELKIFPNPSTGKFIINTTEEINEIIIYDMFGKFVLRSSDKAEIDLNNRPAGIYFAKIKVNGIIVTHKVIKE